MKNFLSVISIFLVSLCSAQIVTLNPSNAGPDDEMTLIFDATEGNGDLVGASKVYLHHGLVTASPESQDWEYVIGNWGADDGIGEMTKVAGETDKWEITMTPTIRQYFGASESESIYRISAVFRSADGNTKASLASGQYGWGEVASNGDFFIDLNVENFLLIDNPREQEIYLNAAESLSIDASASGNVTSMKVFVDNGGGFLEVASVSSGTTISHAYSPAQAENIVIKVTADINGASLETQSEHSIIIKNETTIAALPATVRKGINYNEADPTKATLVLEAPGKDFVFVSGDFNDWLPSSEYQMNKTADGELFWLELNGLESGVEYVFQYWLDGVKIGDPYAEKVADPWNDEYIDEITYPDLPIYTRQSNGMASVLQTNQAEYEWSPAESSWVKPDLDNLVIYELLIRDFIGTHSYVELSDTITYLKNLGVQAIELMPINEFEGNESWGYNPAYYFAPDKYYGTKNELKYFIEKAHQEGLSVIMDMTLNHAFGQNPMVQLYWNDEANAPADDSPWFNEEYVTSNTDWSWGYDFNHESAYTQAFVDSVNSYWIEEFHIDGFRFDFTKGFTQDVTNFDGNDPSRIAILKRMADEIWNVDPETYIIFEHFAAASEETELANYGMKLWRNRNYDYRDIISGNTNVAFNGMDDNTHVSFMSSHDEQRIAFEALSFGISNDDGSYNIRSEYVILERAKLVAAFTFLFPGPKMIWQFDELGYDISIDFNGRVGNKPLPWGESGLGYYEDSFRRNVYKAYQGILDVRNQIGAENLAAASTNHALSGETRRLVYDMVGNDLVVIGNFSVNEVGISPEFTETGSWFDYFSGEEIAITAPSDVVSLKPGEWHIYTSERISDGFPGVVEIAENPVSVSSYPFTQEDEVTITFDVSKASNDGTAGLEGSPKVYMHSGVILLSNEGGNLTNIVGTTLDDGVGEMTEVEEGIWEITITPEDYYSISDDEDIIRIGMYFRDGDNINLGKGYGNQMVFLELDLAGPFVEITPAAFAATDEITITYNSAKGNRELRNSGKIYMHSGVFLTDLQEPTTSWEIVAGNWGQDDGIGEMAPVIGLPNKWSITLTPATHYSIAENSTPFWLSMVFRNADGSIKGTGPAGEIENGIIASNLDFFIKNEMVFVLGSEPLELDDIIVYPNPTSSQLKIDVSKVEADVAIDVFDVLGKSILKDQSYGDKVLSIDVSRFEKGMYLIQIQVGQETSVIRFIKD